MTRPTEMTTLSVILEKLRVKRQDNEFIMTTDGFTAPNGKSYQPEDFSLCRLSEFY